MVRRERPPAAARARFAVVVLTAGAAAATAFLVLAPAPARLAARRAVLRVVGETAALALTIHDPYEPQPEAPPGGLPGPEYFAASRRDTGTCPTCPAGVARVTGVGDVRHPVSPAFRFERWNDPGIVALRESEPITALVATARPDYPSLLAASEWVTHALRYGTARAAAYATHFDAREVLARSRAGEAFDCGTFAWTLIQVLAALGINGRLVELEAEDGASHTVAEAWCDDLAKWIVLDPFAGTTFEHEGRPLNALEIHRLWRSGRAREIRQRHAPGTESRLAALAGGEAGLVAYYAHFNVRMRNNVRSAHYPRWHPQANRLMSAFEWNGDGVGRALFRHRTDDSSRLYFPLKMTALRWDWAAPEAGRPRLVVHLATSAANFDGFVTSRDRRRWERVPARTEIAVVPGADTVWFAARNRAGRVGPESWIATEWQGEPAGSETAASAAPAGGGY